MLLILFGWFAAAWPLWLALVVLLIVDRKADTRAR